MTGELRVPDLVAPVAKVAALRHPSKEVGVAEAAVIEQHRLEDDVGAFPHGGEGVVAPTDAALLVRQVIVPLDFDDRQAFVAERLQEALLVLDASLGDAVQHLVFPDGPRQVSPDGCAFKRRKVRALQVPDESVAEYTTLLSTRCTGPC
ncbi:MAG: hypothetical protein F4Y14_09945 [Acidobacteria bacterium]|nr:hypothetical protein [Acidobacteriota bacterium]